MPVTKVQDCNEPPRRQPKKENFTTRLTQETQLTVKTAVIWELEFTKCDIIDNR